MELAVDGDDLGVFHAIASIKRPSVTEVVEGEPAPEVDQATQGWSGPSGKRGIPRPGLALCRMQRDRIHLLQAACCLRPGFDVGPRPNQAHLQLGYGLREVSVSSPPIVDRLRERQT